LYLILPVHIGLLVFGRPFLAIWLGDSRFAELCYLPLAVISSTLTLVIAQSMAARVLYGTARLRGFARAALLEAAGNVGLGILLGARWGLVGVALGVAAPNLVMCLWVIRHTARGLGLTWRAYVGEAWLRPVLAATVPLTIWLCAHWPVT